jgi:hypothetical protein
MNRSALHLVPKGLGARGRPGGDPGAPLTVIVDWPALSKKAAA